MAQRGCLEMLAAVFHDTVSVDQCCDYDTSHKCYDVQKLVAAGFPPKICYRHTFFLQCNGQWYMAYRITPLPMTLSGLRGYFSFCRLSKTLPSKYCRIMLACICRRIRNHTLTKGAGKWKSLYKYVSDRSKTWHMSSRCCSLTQLRVHTGSFVQ